MLNGPKHQSCWDDSLESSEAKQSLKQQRPPKQTEVCVIGAGITGLMTAYLLSQAGKEVCVVEAKHIGSGTTGATSAHLDPLTDSSMEDLIDQYGELNTSYIINAGIDAISLIELIIQNEGIECEFKRVSGSYIAEDVIGIEHLKQQQKWAQNLRLSSSFQDSLDLKHVAQWPFGNCRALLTFNLHAQFHPTKFLQGLAIALSRRKVKIVEQFPVNEISKNAEGLMVVRSERGSLMAQDVVEATHIPMGIELFTQTQAYPYRSYMLGLKLKQDFPEGLFWDTADPYHYWRKVAGPKGELVIVGGADHKTGEKTDTEQCFKELTRYVRERVAVASIEYQWSAQYYQPDDLIPFIGRKPMSENIYIATGFSGVGLTYGAIAAQIISSQILGTVHKLADLFDPARLSLINGGGKFMKENLKVAFHYVADRLAPGEVAHVDQIQAGEGKLVSHKGKKLAAYRDQEGQLHVMSAVCSHAKGIVKWNSAEQSWDCPCHGGRFSCVGQVIQGPPTRDLEKVDMVEVEQKKTEERKVG